jgi:hypothetical protein
LEVPLVGYYPVTVSDKTRLSRDLLYDEFCSSVKIFDIDSHLYNEFCHCRRFYENGELEPLHEEGLASDALLYPGVRDCEAAWKKIFKYIYPWKHPNRDEEAWKASKAWMYYEFYDSLSGVGLTTNEEVIKVSDLTKSPGPMYTAEFMDKLSVYTSLEGQVELELYWRESARPCGSFSLFSARMKDELRSLEKVEEKNTRVITVAPVTHYSMQQRLFKKQNDKLITTRFKTTCAIGMSRYHGEWHRMIEPFTDLDIASIDVKGLDTSIDPEEMMDIADMRAKALLSAVADDEVCQTAYRIYNSYYEQLNSLIQLPDGSVVLKKTAMPSGVLNTASDDTMTMTRRNFYAIIRCLKLGPSYTDYLRGREFMTLRVCGDDSLIGIKKNTIPFNEFKEAMSEASEIEVEEDHWVQLEQATFLAQKSKIYRGLYVPIPNRVKTWCSLMGNQKGGLENTYQRACGIRLHCYFDTEMYNHIDQYLTHLDEGMGKLLDRSVTSQKLSYLEIERLYLM